jgi:two-component system response regulator
VIRVASDGAAAVDELLRLRDLKEPPPRLVILDLHLPGIDGFEVLRRIRADRETSLVPVVILTSSDDPRDVDRSYVLGANGFVRKPARPHQFELALRRVADYWAALNEVASTQEGAEHDASGPAPDASS